jgi:hypothetical protein
MQLGKCNTIDVLQLKENNMKANYRFKVYRDYADDHVIMAKSANTKREAISQIRKSMELLDGKAPKLNAFEFLSKNTMNVSLKKKYQTRDGKRVELYEIGDLKYSNPVKGNIVLKEKPYKSEYTIWTIHGEHGTIEHPHKYDLVEVK